VDSRGAGAAHCCRIAETSEAAQASEAPDPSRAEGYSRDPWTQAQPVADCPAIRSVGGWPSRGMRKVAGPQCLGLRAALGGGEHGKSVSPAIRTRFVGQVVRLGIPSELRTSTVRAQIHRRGAMREMCRARNSLPLGVFACGENPTQPRIVPPNQAAIAPYWQPLWLLGGTNSSMCPTTRSPAK
jgi:hypothetical protein